MKKQEHKGIGIFRELAALLQPRGIPCRAVIANSAQNWRTPAMLCEIYNQYPIFICASRGEGGPATLLEAAACGCVVISTPVGYSEDIIGSSNGYIVRRRSDEFLEKVTALYEDSESLQAMSQRIQATVRGWDWTIRAKAYEQFLLDHLIV